MGLPGVRTVSILVLALAGCNVEQGGLGTASSSAGSSSGPGGSTGAEPTSSTSRGTEAGSGDTTAGSGTGATGTGSTGGSTGPGSGTSTPESDGGSETGSVGPGEGEPYGPCDGEGECTGDDVVCFTSGRLRTMCLPPCDGGNPSCPPAPPDNESLVECVQVMGVHCMLNCAEAQGGPDSCPAGTVCEEVFDEVFRCLWP